ncbi:MAG: TonB family protein [Acidobacteria bacterium]|nr:MAG: TonB family protein [Acidobacteriota bacterium]
MVVSVGVPAGSDLALYINDRIVRRGPLLSTVFVQSGKSMIASESHVFQRAIMQAIGFPIGQPDTIQYMPKLNMYSVPWVTLKALATETVTPMPVSSDDPGKKRTALVRLSVDSNGLVTDVQYISGDRDLAEAAMEALRSWSFQPFTVHNKPVAVMSILWVVSENGKIWFTSGR